MHLKIKKKKKKRLTITEDYKAKENCFFILKQNCFFFFPRGPQGQVACEVTISAKIPHILHAGYEGQTDDRLHFCFCTYI